VESWTLKRPSGQSGAGAGAVAVVPSMLQSASREQDVVCCRWCWQAGVLTRVLFVRAGRACLGWYAGGYEEAAAARERKPGGAGWS